MFISLLLFTESLCQHMGRLLAASMGCVVAWTGEGDVQGEEENVLPRERQG